MQFCHRLTVDLRVPVEDAWRVIADYARDSGWREGVAMSHEPLGLVQNGTRTVEALRMLGSTHRTEAVISAVEEGRSFRFTSLDGRVEGARALEATPHGSRLSVSIRVRPPAPMSLFSPILGWLFRRRVQRDLIRLRALLEQP